MARKPLKPKTQKPLNHTTALKFLKLVNDQLILGFVSIDHSDPGSQIVLVDLATDGMKVEDVRKNVGASTRVKFWEILPWPYDPEEEKDEDKALRALLLMAEVSECGLYPALMDALRTAFKSGFRYGKKNPDANLIL